MKYYQIKAKYIALLVAQAIVKKFIVPVAGATVVSINASFNAVIATLRLPATIMQAIEDAKHSAQMDAELDAALVDKCFLDRAAVGLTEEESNRIKSLAKDL